MKISLTFLFLFCYWFSFAQCVVEVSVVDSRTNDAIRNATIKVSINDTTMTQKTTMQRNVIFLLNQGRVSFVINHFKYNEKKMVKKITQCEDTLFLLVKMDYIREQNIGEIVVSAPGIPQVVYGSNRVHVSDYEILNDGRIILLTYPKQLKKGSELLIFDGKKVIGQFEVEYKAKELVKDYRGNVHIVCENKVLGILVNGKNISLSVLERNYFARYVAPIIDSNSTKLYFSTFDENYPAFDYFYFDQSDSTYAKILGINDDLMMELYRSEIKWVDSRTRLWALQKEKETGVEAEIIIGANYFTQSLYYKELYAPLFQRNDTLYVFDYYKDQLKYFDASGNALDSVSIYHHYNKRKTGWQANLIQDNETGQIYGVYQRGGYVYLGYVDTKTGEINEQIKLKNKYAEEIKVNGNYVYYIYRPYESIQKKFLYKERLPYDFDKVEMLKQELIVEKKD